MTEYNYNNKFISYNLKIKGKKLSEYAQEIQDAMPPIVKKHAFMIQADAALPGHVPVDTGALKNSIAAKPTDDPKRWEIMDGMEYGVFQELGARGKAGRHFLGNACEKQADPFFSDVKKALKG